MSWEQRIATAGKIEDRIIEHLNSIGWKAFKFGQALLHDECRSMLHQYADNALRPTLLRWMPDIITFGMRNGSAFVALIDAKSAGGDTPNYSVEMSAADVAEIYTDWLYTPTFFVFEGGMLLTPREVQQRGRPGPTKINHGRGSGTPYYLVEKRFARPFDSVFAPLPQRENGAA